MAEQYNDVNEFAASAAARVAATSTVLTFLVGGEAAVIGELVLVTLCQAYVVLPVGDGWEPVPVDAVPTAVRLSVIARKTEDSGDVELISVLAVPSAPHDVGVDSVYSEFDRALKGKSVAALLDDETDGSGSSAR